MMMDIKNFYLNTPLKHYKYLPLKLADIPQDVLENKKTEDEWVYIEIRKGMYSLPQAGLLAQELMEHCLSHNEYTQSKLTPSWWMHHTYPIQFCLVVDDFGIKYVRRENAEIYNAS